MSRSGCHIKSSRLFNTIFSKPIQSTSHSYIIKKQVYLCVCVRTARKRVYYVQVCYPMTP